MIMKPTRRGLITGLVSLVAAPALVRAKSIMPVKSWIEPINPVAVWTVGTIQDAVTACHAMGGGALELGPGVYRLGAYGLVLSRDEEPKISRVAQFVRF